MHDIHLFGLNIKLLTTCEKQNLKFKRKKRKKIEKKETGIFLINTQ